MNRPKIVFFGCTKLSERILEHIINADKCDILGIVTSPQNFKISYSKTPVKNFNFADLQRFKSPSRWVYVYDKNRLDNERLISKMSECAPDIILVVGWYYMIGKQLRECAKYGAWGLHASLLPNYAGGAPLIWAMINQEKESGVTLFRLQDGVDDGEIIKQVSFAINDADYIGDVLEKVHFAASQAILDAIKEFPNNIYVSQQVHNRSIWPQRSPSDGLIDLSKSASLVVSFVRAQSRPYPGAYTNIGEMKIIIWRAEIGGSGMTNKPNLELKPFSLICGDGLSVLITEYEFENS